MFATAASTGKNIQKVAFTKFLLLHFYKGLKKEQVPLEHVDNNTFLIDLIQFGCCSIPSSLGQLTT